MLTPEINLTSIQNWAQELGFSQIGIADVDLSAAEPGLLSWLEQGFHGEMHYMRQHGVTRARPAALVPGTISVITARMDYLPEALIPADAIDKKGLWRASELDRLNQPSEAIVSVYARGRDYHKVLRSRLQKLCDRIGQVIGPFGYRVFTDSAPVLEVELAKRSGQGWRGKHTLLLNKHAGSMFFLGEIYVDFYLPPHQGGVTSHCGRCQSCIDICPTKAIVAPYRLDARRCISYLTIEHPGAIPEDLRPLIGNRIYGCDDCQLVCPWNKYATSSTVSDFDWRPWLVEQSLLTLFAWTEEEFLQKMEGSPIRRIGHERWQRNIAVALGNEIKQSQSKETQQTLRGKLKSVSELVRLHVIWALAQGDAQQTKQACN